MIVFCDMPCGHGPIEVEAPAHTSVRCITCKRRWKLDVAISGVYAWREMEAED